MLTSLKTLPSLFLQPIHRFRGYRASNLRLDAVAGLTVAVILLPQAMAYALIAELPPEVGLYTAIVAAIVGALWGSSNHLQTGPTNAISLLILSTLFTMAVSGTAEYLVLAGLLAVMVGVIQMVMGLAQLGMLVNFVSHSVIVGFAAGAGVLIAIQQLRHLLGLEFSSHGLFETIQGIVSHLPDAHLPTLALGLGTMLLIVLLRRLNPRLPGLLIAMVVAAALVGLLGLNKQGVVAIGEMPRSLPPLAKLPLLSVKLLGQLAPGALAVAAIGLVQASSIARSIATQSGQRLDSNQEFVGQGLANIAAGLLSGYPSSGSFIRSAINFETGARTPMASIFSGLFVLIAMLILAPLTAYVPRAALAGVLIVTAYGMVDRAEIVRIWRGARADAGIMIVTFASTLFLPLEFAVLAGILFSFAMYIVKTSVPQVTPVLPDENFRHFTHQPQKADCPQVVILDIYGDLYFGAVSHVEETIQKHLTANLRQRFLLLRMHSVDHCDFSGIHALEGVVRIYRDLSGDVFLVRVYEPILNLMKSTGFYEYLGIDHFLSEDEAVSYLYHRVIDPAICVYECDARVFKECQNLPRPTYSQHIPVHTEIPTGSVAQVSPRDLWQQLCSDTPPLIIDVREPREFERGHVPRAQLLPLPKLLADTAKVPRDRPVIFVCQSGRRSTRAAFMLQHAGYENLAALQGGILAWEAADLLQALDISS